MEALTFGDWVFIQRNREDTGLPGDVVERVGLVVGANEVGVWLAFPGGYKDKLGITLTPLSVPYGARNQPYTLRRMVLRDTYPAGRVGCKVPTDLLMSRNDTRYGKCLALCEGKWEALWADIMENGMRHPPVVSTELAIHSGLSRIYAHHKAGQRHVECFIYDPREY